MVVSSSLLICCSVWMLPAYDLCHLQVSFGSGLIPRVSSWTVVFSVTTHSAPISHWTGQLQQVAELGSPPVIWLDLCCIPVTATANVADPTQKFWELPGSLCMHRYILISSSHWICPSASHIFVWSTRLMSRPGNGSSPFLCACRHLALAGKESALTNWYPHPWVEILIKSIGRYIKRRDNTICKFLILDFRWHTCVF